ncbi:MAG TPA: hypothetical protein VFY57_09100 [Rubrobacteraceae bacterium]|nr:hypothetical protein [Rubrobacteraceae bacterium]
MTLLVVLVIFMVAFGLLLYGAVWATNAMIGKSVVEKHRALEEIVNTGRVPRDWSEPQERGGSGSDPKARERYLKKIDALSRYVESSRLVEGEETRELLLDRLSDLRSSLRDGQKERDDGVRKSGI